MSEKPATNSTRSPALTAFLLALLALIFVGGLVSLVKQRTSAPETDSVSEKEAIPIEENNPPAPAGTPEALVIAFCESFFNAAPPEGDPNGPEAETARAFLTETARTEIDESNPPSIFNGLLRFATVEEIPDQGFRLGQVDVSPNQATVETAWVYSDGTVPKTLVLSRRDDRWQVASIE